MPHVPRPASGDRGKSLECNALLRELLDQPDLILQLRNVFAGETQKDIENLMAACVAHDSARVASIAHRLKGSAATIGAEPLLAAAARIERFGRQGRLPQVQECVPSLNVEFVRFCSFLSTLAESEQS